MQFLKKFQKFPKYIHFNIEAGLSNRDDMQKSTEY